MFPSSIFSAALAAFQRGIDWRDVLRFLSMILLIVGAILFAIGLALLCIKIATDPYLPMSARTLFISLVALLLGLGALKVANG